MVLSFLAGEYLLFHLYIYIIILNMEYASLILNL